MTSTEVLDRIERLFAERGAGEYHGEAVSQLEHALQSALLAERDGRPATWIAAALLHDIGHLLHGHGEEAAAKGIDDHHEELGVRFLSQAFGPDVTEPVRLHVAAKRYLAVVNPDYPGLLSPASRRSLELQGGPMSPSERDEFERQPHFAAAAAIREYDDRAKQIGLATPVLAHFKSYLEESLRAYSPR